MLKAEAEGVPYTEIVDKYHGMFVDGCVKMGLTFDLYTHTDTENHWDVTQEVFARHWETGYIYLDVQKQWFDPRSQASFWPTAMWRVNAPSAVMPVRAATSATPVGGSMMRSNSKTHAPRLPARPTWKCARPSTSFSTWRKMNQPLLDWIATGKEHWRPNVLNFTRGQLELRELRGRAITRDLDWGIPIPIGNAIPTSASMSGTTP
jgi:methionyl-tRNA synthetase